MAAQSVKLPAEQPYEERQPDNDWKADDVGFFDPEYEGNGPVVSSG